MLNLQFITHSTHRYTYTESARMALEGGCRWIQLRMKEASDEEWIRTGREVGALCRQYHAKFILDDRADLVGPLHADGVHLGKQDMPIDEARKWLGPHALIGGTANTTEDIEMHARKGADYIGCGPFRFTTTKKNLAPVLGLEGYRHIIDYMHKENIRLPIVAIGGITYDDIPSILQTGVQGIALSSTILQAENPVEETRRILNITV